MEIVSVPDGMIIVARYVGQNKFYIKGGTHKISGDLSIGDEMILEPKSFQKYNEHKEGE